MTTPNLEEPGRLYHRHTKHEQVVSSLHRFYRVAPEGHKRFEELIQTDAPGRRALDLCCGQGTYARKVAAAGAEHVTGIDLMAGEIETARKLAEEEGLRAVAFEVMDAMELTFADASFDLVVGGAALHQLDVERALAGIARVMTPDGQAVFLEPLGHNPAINWYRRRTADLREANEGPLRLADIGHMRQFFSQVEAEFFNLFALAAAFVPEARGRELASTSLRAVDRVVLRALPFLRRFCWVVVVRLSQPIKAQ